MDITQVVKKILKTKLGWSVLSGLFKIIDKLYYIKEEVRKDFERKADVRLFEYFTTRNKLYVANGTFKGLIYPEATAICSAIYPKLIGSYEEELQPYFNKKIKENKVRQIIDIGCAEGYYAVGLAKVLPQCTIHAYDIDDNAIRLCKNMSALNKVSDRVLLKKVYEHYTIKEYNTNIPTLVICDCEGYERELFTAENIKYFAKCDVLIELHPLMNEDIEVYLKNLFQKTHSVNLVQGKKRSPSRYSHELESLNYFEKEYALSEMRPHRMDWFIFEPINDN